jgi:predicted glutamine amidotransferase
MCRWMAYSGDPILAEDLLFKPQHSIIDQSLHSRMGATTTNGDGFGIGWYGEGVEPAMFKSIEPAWNDWNLREVAGQIRTRLLFAHIRASTGTPVQRSNCHPFRHDRWLWMHNGAIREFHNTKRDLMMALDPSLFLDIEGSTDSETLFFLALTFGLTDDPFDAVARAIGLVEKVGHDHGVCTSPLALRRCVSCILRWRSCTPWVRRPDWSSLNHSVIFPERGTKSPSPRQAWCVQAWMRCAPSSRSRPENAAATFHEPSNWQRFHSELPGRGP